MINERYNEVPSLKSQERRSGYSSASTLSDNDHNIPLTKLKEKYYLDESIFETGLYPDQVNFHRTEYGSNVFTKSQKSTPPYVQFFYLYIQPFNLLLLTASILSLIVYRIDKTSINLNLDMNFKNKDHSSDRFNLYLGFFIFSVTLFNTFLEFYQEFKVKGILKGFKGMVPNKCTVLRNNEVYKIPCDDIVVCDIILVKMGDRVGADIRLVDVCGLKVDNSSLTGESVPIRKYIEDNNKDLSVNNTNYNFRNLDFNETNTNNEENENINSVEYNLKKTSKKSSNESKFTDKNHMNNDYSKSPNMILCGDTIISGTAKGIVIKTGNKTVLGKIASLATSNDPSQNELTLEINNYVRKLSICALLTCIIFYTISLLNGFKLKDNLIFCIGLFIAFVPQGLPCSVSILLTLAAQRMSRKNVLVKDLKAVETLGSVSLLASDKTGTLTKGEMECVSLWDGSEVIDLIEDSNFCNRALSKTVRMCLYGSGVSVDAKGKVMGDPTETALRNLAKKNSEKMIFDTNSSVLAENLTKKDVKSNKSYTIIDIYKNSNTKKNDSKTIQNIENESNQKNLKNDNHIKIVENENMELIHEESFNSEKKIHVCLYKTNKNTYILCVKGAPERVLKLSSHFFKKNVENIQRDDLEHISPINSKFIDNFNNTYNELASNGQRVIAFAEKELNEKELIEKYGCPDFFSKLNNCELNLNIKTKDTTKNDENYSNLNFVSMVGIVDPPKEGVRNAIMQLRISGIQVVMVTGDHPLTAEYIAKQICIISGKTKEDIRRKRLKEMKEKIFNGSENNEKYKNISLEKYSKREINISAKSQNEKNPEKNTNVKETGSINKIDNRSSNSEDFNISIDEYDAEVINGDDIPLITPAEWKKILKKKEIIFTRTSPQQKLKIVEMYQQKGHIVGVCGDGVNDALALKKAHLGISMNKTGSEVSKDQASMILVDDNFCSIVNGVREGRLVFSNLKKCVRYILSHISPQVVPFLLYVGLGVPSPMSPLLLMVIDLFTEFLPSVGLAYEECEGNLMMEHPRKIGMVNNEENDNNAELNGDINQKENHLNDKITININENTNEKNKKNLASNNSISGNENKSDNNNFIIDSNEEDCQKENAKFSFIEEIISTLKNITKRNPGETLCDMDLLSWSYLEAGMLITLGALGSFFITLHKEGLKFSQMFRISNTYFKKGSSELTLNNKNLKQKLKLNEKEQMEVLYKAQCAYFIGILIGQAFNIIACKKRWRGISKKTFKNIWPIVGTILGLIFGYLIVRITVYAKGMMYEELSIEALLFPISTGILILLWDGVRKRFKRSYNLFGKKRDIDMVCTLKKTKKIKKMYNEF